jgi:tRNA (uracil-5-)-methyltransferase
VAVEEVNRLLERTLCAEEEVLNVFGGGGAVYTAPPDETEAEVLILGRTIRFPVAGFFQSNIPALEALLTEIIPWIEPLKGGRAVDLYAGSGLFGVFAAPFFEDFVSVEPDLKSASRAEINVPGSSVFSGSAEDWIERFGKTFSPDLIICDPPRTGLSSGVRDYIGRSGADGVLYISCDPVTFARDGAELKKRGYRLFREILCDFFPQTPHVETAGLFLH